LCPIQEGYGRGRTQYRRCNKPEMTSACGMRGLAPVCVLEASAERQQLSAFYESGSPISKNEGVEYDSKAGSEKRKEVREGFEKVVQNSWTPVKPLQR